MKDIPMKVIGGVLLIVAGVLFLMQELALLGNAFEYLWVIILALGGGFFLYLFISEPDQWWAVIPSLALFGLSLAAAEDMLGLFPSLDLGGAVFLGSLGLSFWLVYARQPNQWWPIIPGGVLITLGLVAGLEPVIPSGGGVFFLGLALTFSLVGLLPGQAETRWAFIPAAALALLGVSLLITIDRAVINMIWPAVMILIGGYLLVRNLFQ